MINYFQTNSIPSQTTPKIHKTIGQSQQSLFTHAFTVQPAINAKMITKHQNVNRNSNVYSRPLLQRQKSQIQMASASAQYGSNSFLKQDNIPDNIKQNFQGLKLQLSKSHSDLNFKAQKFIQNTQNQIKSQYQEKIQPQVKQMNQNSRFNLQSVFSKQNLLQQNEIKKAAQNLQQISKIAKTFQSNYNKIIGKQFDQQREQERREKMKKQEDLFDLEDNVPVQVWDQLKDFKKQIPIQDLMRQKQLENDIQNINVSPQFHQQWLDQEYLDDEYELNNQFQINQNPGQFEKTQISDQLLNFYVDFFIYQVLNPYQYIKNDEKLNENHCIMAFEKFQFFDFINYSKILSEEAAPFLQMKLYSQESNDFKKRIEQIFVDRAVVFKEKYVGSQKEQVEPQHKINYLDNPVVRGNGRSIRDNDHDWNNSGRKSLEQYGNIKNNNYNDQKKEKQDFINNPVVRGNGRSIKDNTHDWRSFEKQVADTNVFKIQSSSNSNVTSEDINKKEDSKFKPHKQLIKYYLEYYYEQLAEVNKIVMKNYMDNEFVQNKITESQKEKAVKKFNLHQFYEISEAFSEGAAGFLKFRNDQSMGQYILNMWNQEYQTSLVYHA